MAEPDGPPAGAGRRLATAPRVIAVPKELRQLTAGWTGSGQLVGLVPTMGSLHAGHMSLVAAAQRECDKVVVSIFVNPLQFAKGEDYLSYPRRLDADLALLAEQGVDACYCPQVETVYPEGFATRVLVDAGSELWESAMRPGHFSGVATVVSKLFAAAGPGRAYFGEKDAQQAAVVSRLAKDLDLGVEVSVCPTVRDPDGLALSSRNQLLSAAGYRAARCLSRALIEAARRFAAGVVSGAELSAAAAQVIDSEPGVRFDYAGVVDPADFRPVIEANGATRVLVAAGVEGVHLIDTSLLASPPRASR